MLILIVNAFANAQTIQVSGRVTSNESDSAVSAASIKIKGTNTGIAAGDNGNFTITAAPNATLVISAVGYITREIPINNQTNITVRLVSGTHSLEQVVVVVRGAGVLQPLCAVRRQCHRLRGDPPRAHFGDAHRQHAQAHHERECCQRRAGGDQMLLWSHRIPPLPSP